MSRKKVILDVREDLKRGREPFSTIMRAVSALGPKEDLVLLAPFAPTPLYAVLGQQGFHHAARELESGDWEVVFSKSAAPEPQKPTLAAQETSRCPQPEVELDARGLEPPQPLVTILEAVEGLQKGQTLHAHTDRRPMHLFTHLKERGCAWTLEELADGSFLTHVTRG